MVIPLAVGAGGALIAGGVAGSLFGKKSSKPVDISRQLADIKDTYARNQSINAALPGALNPLTQDYRTDLKHQFDQSKADFATNKAEYLGATDANTKAAQDAQRANVYGDTFNGLPDALRSVREASAAGGGIGSGAYQQSVRDVGVSTAQKLASGERDIQIAGLQNKQSAQENAFNTFNNLSAKLSDQQIQGLTKVLDTGREDLIRQYTTKMGLNEAETQSVVDLLNFQQSSEFAKNTAADADRQSLYTSLIGTGGTLIASAPKEAAPKEG